MGILVLDTYNILWNEYTCAYVEKAAPRNLI